MDDEDRLLNFEVLHDELMARARTAREQENRELSNQCFNSEIILSEFEPQFAELQTSHRRKLTRACLNRPGQKLYQPPTTEAPILFEDNQPVTKLFVYNIKDRTLTKEKLTELFFSHAVVNFQVSNICDKTATVSCDELEMSCKLQCLALVGKFKWSYHSTNKNKTYKGILKMRPDNSLKTGEVPLRGEVAPVEKQPQANEVANFDNHPFSEVLRKTNVFREICSYLKSIDLYNLYKVIKSSEFISSLFFSIAFHVNIEISGPWLVGPSAVDYFNQIITIANPPNLLFQDINKPVCPSIALKFLKTIASRNAESNQKITRMKMLDLSGVVVTESLIKYVSERFKIESIKLGKTTRQFD